MSQRTISMRKMKEIMRLSASGLSQRQIARSLNLSKGTVSNYLKHAKKQGLDWSTVQDLEGKDIKETLVPKPLAEACKIYTQPDCHWIYQELKRKGVTLKLLHEEYCKQFPDNHYLYTQFCHYYRQWRRKQDLSVRQTYKAGDQLFIDYAGPTVPIVDRRTGKIKEASIFIATLGASHYAYVEATWDQQLANWIASHVRAFEHFGGVPALLVPDNLKQGVHHACPYDPDLNPTYTEMAAHYNVAIMPARPYKPKDKSKVESAVLIVERWILARLRHQVFYSLEDLNQGLRVLADQLNREPFQKLPGCRLSQFKEIDQPALNPLPAKPYVYAVFKRKRVGKDYHVEVEKHFYSVPYSYAYDEVEVRITAHIIEVYKGGQRIACHERKREPGFTTLPAHQPRNHYFHTHWTVEGALKWAHHVGKHTHQLLAGLFNGKAHSHQQYRLFLGFIKVGRSFGEKRLEAACQQTLIQGAGTYKRIKAVLENGLDRHPLEIIPKEPEPIEHSNIRGATYYQQETQS
jgi:transposase